MKAPEYDPGLLRALAGQLHRQAAGAVLSNILGGIFTGALFGYAATLIFATLSSLVIPGMIGGGILGWPLGRRKAQALRLQAQVALCQLEIEQNTRPSLSPPTPPVAPRA